MHSLGRALEQLAVLPTPNSAVEPAQTPDPADADTDAAHQPPPIKARRTSGSSQVADFEWLEMLLANAAAPAVSVFGSNIRGSVCEENL